MYNALDVGARGVHPQVESCSRVGHSVASDSAQVAINLDEILWRNFVLARPKRNVQ